MRSARLEVAGFSRQGDICPIETGVADPGHRQVARVLRSDRGLSVQRWPGAGRESISSRGVFDQ